MYVSEGRGFQVEGISTKKPGGRKHSLGDSAPGIPALLQGGSDASFGFTLDHFPWFYKADS